MSELNQVIGVHVYECGWVGRHMQYVIYRKISELTIQTDKEFKFIKRLSRYELYMYIMRKYYQNLKFYSKYKLCSVFINHIYA